MILNTIIASLVIFVLVVLYFIGSSAALRDEIGNVIQREPRRAKATFPDAVVTWTEHLDEAQMTCEPSMPAGTAVKVLVNDYIVADLSAYQLGPKLTVPASLRGNRAIGGCYCVMYTNGEETARAPIVLEKI